MMEPNTIIWINYLVYEENVKNNFITIFTYFGSSYNNLFINAMKNKKFFIIIGRYIGNYFFYYLSYV